MTTRTIFAALLCLYLVLGAAVAQEGEEDVCRRGETAKVLDFWLGDWKVTDPKSGDYYGSNKIEMDLKGCAIFEHWTDRTGGQGKSLFYFDATGEQWTQVWVTEDTSQPWGLKVKQMVQRLDDGGLSFQGVLKDKEGNSYLDRTTLTPLPDGSVRQLIEISTDAGASWKTTFDALYARP